MEPPGKVMITEVIKRLICCYVSQRETTATDSSRRLGVISFLMGYWAEGDQSEDTVRGGGGAVFSPLARSCALPSCVLVFRRGPPVAPTETSLTRIDKRELE